MKWAPQALSLELRKIFSYRMDFWASFIGTVVAELGLAYFLWKAVYEARGVESLDGYSFRGMMLYYLLVPLTGRLMRGNEMGIVSDDIYDGGLTRYLVYPVSFLQYKYISHLAFALIATLQLLVAFGAFVWLVGTPPESHLGLVQLGMGLVAALIGSLLFFLMLAAVEMVSFWQENVWSLSVMLKFVLMLLGGGLLPIAFFPKDFQPVLAQLPFTYVASFPVDCMMGLISPARWVTGMGIAAAWIAVFAAIAGWVWRRGVRQYSGVGL
jgi:ABC-2 type transport system permease protein